jgi:hypothetical protein
MQLGLSLVPNLPSRSREPLIEDMIMKPYDVVEYWHGHKEVGAVGPYDVPRASFVGAVLRGLHDWYFIQFRLRNGQIIRVKLKEQNP